MRCLISKKSNYLVISTLLVMLSACCSPGVKPGDANLFQAGCGVASGQYEEDLKEKQKLVDESDQENSTVKGRSLQLETMLVQRKSEHQSAQQELAALEKQNSAVSNTIHAMQVKTQKDQKLKEQYLQKLQLVKNEIETLKTKVSETPGDDYQAKFEELKREVETLRIIVLGQ